MRLFLLERTCLYWVINLNVNTNFIALHLEESRNTNVTIQIARPKEQTLRPSVFLRNFKQDTSIASSLPPSPVGCSRADGGEQDLPGRVHSRSWSQMVMKNLQSEVVWSHGLGIFLKFVWHLLRVQVMAIGQVVSHIPLCCSRINCSYNCSWVQVRVTSTILWQRTSPARIWRRLVH